MHNKNDNEKNKNSTPPTVHTFGLLEKAKLSHSLSKNEIIELLNSPSEPILKAADEVRKKYVGDEIHLRGLIEFSNICKQNCLYCGIRRENEKIERYRFDIEEIIKIGKKAVEFGYKTLVLQSGEDGFYTQDKMCEIIKELKKLDVALTISSGEKTLAEFEAYKQAGADRYLIRIETTDNQLYEQNHPSQLLATRIEALKNLKQVGFEVGSGCLVGLPNQSLTSLADDILFFKQNDFDMIGIGPFIPNEDTPLKEAHAGSFDLALKVMAIVRILMPNINIPATTAMETLQKNGRLIALQSGANVIMPNVGDCRKKYVLYPGKPDEDGLIEKNSFVEKIYSIGRSISADYGQRKKKIV